MNNFLKLNVLALYALAIADLVTDLPFGLSTNLRNIAGVMLLIHVVEIIAARKYLALYRGSRFDSIVLGLLFGLLHFKPLKDRQQRDAV
jgi:uncharacterized protein YhhL (DUF1145 family)